MNLIMLYKPNKPWTACMKDENVKTQLLTKYYMTQIIKVVGSTECAACCPYGSRNLPIERAYTEEKLERL